MYAEGQGVPQNFVTAHMWLKLGGTAGNAAKMTVAQIAEGAEVGPRMEASPKMIKH
jgi:TPR repeat protein